MAVTIKRQQVDEGRDTPAKKTTPVVIRTTSTPTPNVLASRAAHNDPDSPTARYSAKQAGQQPQIVTPSRNSQPQVVRAIQSVSKNSKQANNMTYANSKKTVDDTPSNTRKSHVLAKNSSGTSPRQDTPTPGPTQPAPGKQPTVTPGPTEPAPGTNRPTVTPMAQIGVHHFIPVPTNIPSVNFLEAAADIGYLGRDFFYDADKAARVILAPPLEAAANFFYSEGDSTRAVVLAPALETGANIAYSAGGAAQAIVHYGPPILDKVNATASQVGHIIAGTLAANGFPALAFGAETLTVGITSDISLVSGILRLGDFGVSLEHGKIDFGELRQGVTNIIQGGASNLIRINNPIVQTVVRDVVSEALGFLPSH